MRANQLATDARNDYQARPYQGPRPAVWPMMRNEPGAMSGGFAETRDSDALEQSNFRIALQAYEAAGIEVSIDHFGHWAVGWIDYLTVPITRAAIEVLTDLRDRVENYPILDDDDYNEAQWSQDHPGDGHCYSESMHDFGEPCYCGLPTW